MFEDYPIIFLLQHCETCRDDSQDRGCIVTLITTADSALAQAALRR